MDEHAQFDENINKGFVLSLNPQIAVLYIIYHFKLWKENNMLSLQENDFKSEVLDAKGLVLVDFWAEWCGPCRQLGPILEKASEQIADVKFCKVNVDEAPNTAASFGIRSIPSMFLFKDGKQIDVKVGFSSEASIVDWLNSYK